MLGQLGTVASYARWLNPLRKLGMAALFSGVILTLNVIIGTLGLQANPLVNVLGAAGPVISPGDRRGNAVAT